MSEPRSSAAAGDATPTLRARAVRIARAAASMVANRFDPPVLILAYHRVTTLARDPHALAVRPDRFAAQLEVLKRRFALRRFDDARPVSRPAAVLTFDDGYADNLLEALPLLERHDVPATFFVTTGPVDSQTEFWWDALERALLTDVPRPTSFSTPREPGTEWPTATEAERRALHDALHPKLKRLPPDQRDGWITELRRWSLEPATPRPSHRPMTADEVRRLSVHPLASVGAHTVRHPVLASLPVEAQREELRGARRQLEHWIGRPVTIASFPFGAREDFDATTVSLTAEAGFVRNAANVAGSAHRWSDRLALPRHLVRDWDRAEFERRLDRFLLT